MPNIKQALVDKLNKSCWNCGANKLGGATLLGNCQEWGKEITAKQNDKGQYICDIGCSKWRSKDIIDAYQ